MKQFFIFCIVIFVSVLSAGKSTTADAIVIFSTLGLTGSLIFVNKKIFRLDTSKKLLLSFILIHLWSLSFSVKQSVSFLTSYQAWAFLGIVYLFSFTASIYLSTTKVRSRFAEGLVLGAGIISLVTVFYYISGIKPPQGDLSLFFPTYGHDRFAEFFLPIIPISVYLLLDRKRAVLIRLAALFSITNLFISFSRASLISLFLLPVIAVFVNLSTDKKVKKWISATAVVALVTLLLFTPIWLTSKGFKPDTHPLMYILDKPFTAKERIDYFTDALAKWSRKKISGYGPGTYHFTTPNFRTNPTSTIFVHNHTLQSLYEGGALGLFTEAMLIIWAIISARRSCRGIADKLILAGVILSLTQAQLDFGWEIPIVYLVNLVFLFSLTNDPKKNPSSAGPLFSRIVAISLFVFALLFSLLSFGSILPWTPTPQMFQNLILSSYENGDKPLQQRTIDRWLRFEGGNGEVYKWLYQFNLHNGDLQEAFDNFQKVEKTVFLRNSLNINELTPFIKEMSTSPNALSVQDRFELLKVISNSYEPHDFFWLNEDLQTAIYSITDNLLLPSTTTGLNNLQLSQLHYWKYTQMLTRGMTNYEINQQSIDRAHSLDVSNQRFSLISQINRALTKADTAELLHFLDQLQALTSASEKPTALLGLRDHINMKLGDIYMKKGDLVSEMKHRREAINGTQTPIAYIQLAKRLNQLDQRADSASILEECTKLYPDCRVWLEKSLK